MSVAGKTLHVVRVAEWTRVRWAGNEACMGGILNPQRKRPLWGCKIGKEGMRGGRRNSAFHKNGVLVLKKESVAWTGSTCSSSSSGYCGGGSSSGGGCYCGGGSSISSSGGGSSISSSGGGSSISSSGGGGSSISSSGGGSSISSSSGGSSISSSGGGSSISSSGGGSSISSSSGGSSKAVHVKKSHSGTDVVPLILINLAFSCRSSSPQPAHYTN